MNISPFMTIKYVKLDTWLSWKNKPNSNPNKPNLVRRRRIANVFIIKDYRKKDDFVVRINKPNLRNDQNERILSDNKGLQKKRLFSSPKNKPNSNPNKPIPELAEALSAAEGAVEKFLSLWSESFTIIRKSVIRQFKRGRLGMFKFRLRLSMLVSMLALETRSSCVQLPVSIPASIPTNKLLKLVRSKFGDSLLCQRNFLQKRWILN